MGPAVFESFLERDFHTLLCCDPRVDVYAVQAHELTYWTPNEDGTFTQRSYTPDFVVQLRGGRILVVEVKAEFLASEEYWRAREPHIRETYARDYGVQFVVVTEREVRVQPRLDNLKSMLRYGGRAVDPAADIAVRDALSVRLGDSTLGEISERAQLAYNKVSRAYSALMRLALNGEVIIDLNSRISAASRVKRAA